MLVEVQLMTEVGGQLMLVEVQLTLAGFYLMSVEVLMSVGL